MKHDHLEPVFFSCLFVCLSKRDCSCPTAVVVVVVRLGNSLVHRTDQIEGGKSIEFGERKSKKMKKNNCNLICLF